MFKNRNFQLTIDKFYLPFSSLSAIEPVPDHSTISCFRSDLKAMNLTTNVSPNSNAKLLKKALKFASEKSSMPGL